MKLHKVLSINGQPFDLVNDEVRLDLRNPGRASFTVKVGRGRPAGRCWTVRRLSPALWR